MIRRLEKLQFPLKNTFLPFPLPWSGRWSGCPRAGPSQTAGSPRSRGPRSPGSPPSAASPPLQHTGEDEDTGVSSLHNLKLSSSLQCNWLSSSSRGQFFMTCIKTYIFQTDSASALGWSPHTEHTSDSRAAHLNIIDIKRCLNIHTCDCAFE